MNLVQNTNFFDKKRFCKKVFLANSWVVYQFNLCREGGKAGRTKQTTYQLIGYHKNHSFDAWQKQ
jgi:hypothetical protein